MNSPENAGKLSKNLSNKQFAMNPYNHTQKSGLIIILMVALAMLFGFLSQTIPEQNPFLLIGLVIIILLTSFISLNIQVDEDSVRLKFGYGLIRKHFAINNIKSVKIVQNRWYHGWGIHFWLWPKMWIFNIAGFDAIELVTKNDKRYRIGTDDPYELEKAIKQYIQ